MFKFLNTLNEYSNEYMFKTLDRGFVVGKRYSDYLMDIRKCAYQLENCMGQICGMHIGVISHSCYEYLVLLGAIIFSRGVAVPINEKESEKNISFVVDNSDINALIVEEITDQFSFNNVRTLNIKHLFCDSEKEKQLNDFDETESDNLAMILYTSGTTAMSKGVSMSVGNLFYDQRRINIKKYYYNPEETRGALVYTNFPFYHLAGVLAWITYSENGCTICYSKEAKNILSDLENIEIDFAAVTPSVLKLWIKSLKHGRIDRLGKTKNIISGGAKIDPELADAFKSYGIGIAQTYGQTEVCGAVTYNFDMENHSNSIGKAIDGAYFKIIDGEICIDFWGNMLGYYKNHEETVKTLKDGLIYTGDLGYIDEDGYIYLTGRKKNLIVLSGGENVSPEEIESKLYENSSIKECRVYEKNDSIYADIFAPNLNEREVKDYIKEINKTMPMYKRINHVVLKDDELEKTSLGKIKRVEKE